VDVALVDTLVSSMQIINQIYLATDRLPQRIGNRYESTYPYDTFPTKDGETIVIGCANDKVWKILCKLMNRADLIEHPQMVTNKLRVENHALIRPIVEAWTLTGNARELVELLLDNGCPAAFIYNIKQVTEDPHIAGDREMFPEIEYPRIGKLRVTGSHFKFSETKVGPQAPSPDLGQHNNEVYKEFLGYTDEQIAVLKEEGVI
jgi:formyl-CoA transferase